MVGGPEATAAAVSASTICRNKESSSETFFSEHLQAGQSCRAGVIHKVVEFFFGKNGANSVADFFRCGEVGREVADRLGR